MLKRENHSGMNRRVLSHKRGFQEHKQGGIGPALNLRLRLKMGGVTVIYFQARYMGELTEEKLWYFHNGSSCDDSDSKSLGD